MTVVRMPERVCLLFRRAKLPRTMLALLFPDDTPKKQHLRGTSMGLQYMCIKAIIAHLLKCVNPPCGIYWQFFWLHCSHFRGHSLSNPSHPRKVLWVITMGSSSSTESRSWVSCGHTCWGLPRLMAKELCRRQFLCELQSKGWLASWFNVIYFLKWLPLLTSTADVDSTFKQMQSLGVKVLRTWVSWYPRPSKLELMYAYHQGFNAINGSELAGAQQSGLTYYQVTTFWVICGISQYIN